MESASTACIPVLEIDCGIAEAEMATAQPAIKATRLTFMMIAPNVFLTNAAKRIAERRLSA
jgi:hypothetical protein